MSERDMRELQNLLARRIGVQWTDIVEWLRSQNSVEVIEQKLATGRIEDVIADVQTAAEKFAADLHNAYLDSGRRAAEWLDSKVSDTMISFDAAAPQAVYRARTEAAQQVAGLTDEARQNVRQAIADGVQAGASPIETARRIRESIGLHPQQEQWLANYRAALEAGDWDKALGYELSSGHGDRTIRRLQRDNGSLTAGQVEDLSERYRQNAITYRAELIARSESLAAANGGAMDAMRQAIGRGDVDADELEKEWHSSPRRRYSRLDHQEMDGKPVGVDEDFILPDGSHMSHPGDPRGGAKNCAGCGCTFSISYRAAG